MIQLTLVVSNVIFMMNIDVYLLFFQKIYTKLADHTFLKKNYNPQMSFPIDTTLKRGSISVQ